MVDPSIRLIELHQRRARYELEVLANLAPGLRQGMAILAECGVGEELFGEPDCFAVFAAMRISQRYPTVIERARTVRTALRLVELWDEALDRRYLGGVRWGPGPVAVLFTRMEYYPGRLVESVVRLQYIIEQIEKLPKNLRVKDDA